MAGAWVSLFSGGKDSTYALFLAQQRGLPVDSLLTVHPEEDSYMYHVPATDLATLAAESIGLPLVDVDPGVLDTATAVDAGAQGDTEVEPLRAALADLAADRDIEGLIVGAVESEFQASRIRAVAEDLGLDVYAPLWGREPRRLASAVVAAGFAVVIIRVAAAGLDEAWLGRRLDAAALADLEALNDQYGVHVLGEGGEYETLVTDGPHMTRPIEFEADVQWDGTRGTLAIHEAWLGER